MAGTEHAVLVVAYEYPPSGGGGVQRVAKFTRYLPAAGWRPVVVAGEPAEGRPLDMTLAAEVADVSVVRTPSRRVSVPVSKALNWAWGVRGALRRLIGRRRPSTPAASGGAGANGAARSDAPKSGARPVGWTARITSTIAIPDVAAYWIGPTVRAGVRAGRREKVEAVFASGPPHSALVAGSRIAARLGVPFVADMRDAWRDNPGAWYPTAWHERAARAHERRALAGASVVTAVSEPIVDEALQMGARRAVLLPNGFDRADVPAWDPADGPVRVAFMGVMYPTHSDPATLFEGLARVARDPGAAEIGCDVIGPEAAFAVAEAASVGVSERVRFLGYRPHAEALDLLSHADAGVVLIRDTPGARASYTGKIFEYLGMGIPILLIGPVDGVAAQLVRDAGAGIVVPWGDADACASALLELAEDKAQGRRRFTPDPEVVRRFDRASQAATLAGLLDEVAGVRS